MTTNKNKIFGFTLIELLVVISIIGLLASIVLVALNSARQKARDAKRIADLNQIVTAAELFNSNYGFYPASPGLATWDLMYDNFATCITTGTSCYQIDNSGNVTGPTTVPNFQPVVAKIPQDPQYVRGSTGPYDGGTVKFYWPPYPPTTYDGTKFVIRTLLEDSNNPAIKASSGGDYYNYVNGCAAPYYCLKIK